jgi:small subunit ribosomal protein S9
MAQNEYYYGTGRRKSAIARVRLIPGDGQVIVNGKTLGDYFGGRELYRSLVMEPLVLTGNLDRLNVMIKIAGGGVSGQAGAARHGVARALIVLDANLRSVLKKAGYLTRDSRVKERKKPGLKRARKAPQYTKR